MATKKCGFWASSHRWAKKTKAVRPGTFQKTCTRCGKVKNIKCGTFFYPHKWKRDRRRRKNILVCKMCTQKKEAQ